MTTHRMSVTGSDISIFDDEKTHIMGKMMRIRYIAADNPGQNVYVKVN